MRYTNEKGTTVKPTEQITKSASTPKAGLFARLRGLLHVEGSGAPSRRRYVLAALSTLSVLAGGLLLTSAPAYAFVTYGVSSSFGSHGSGDGQFINPEGIALNESTEPVLDPEAGDAYVADTGNKRVQWFALNPATEHYEYAGQWGGEQTPAKSLNTIGGIAIDNSTNPLDPSAGDVYVASDSGGEPAVVDKFSATGVYQGQLTGGCENKGETAVEPGACPGSASKQTIPFIDKDVEGVAADPEGHLFVFAGSPGGIGEGTVDEFSSEGIFLGTFIFRIDEGSAGIAVDSSDSVYGLTESAKTGNAVDKFDSATGASIGELGDGGAHDSSSIGATALAVDPADNHVFVGHGDGFEEYGAFGEPYAEPLLTYPSHERSSALAGSHGIAVSKTGTVFATQGGAASVEVFNQIFPPTVVAELVSGRTATTVTLNGAVNPEGRQITSCEFEYGTNASYGHVAECEPRAAGIGAGSGAVSVHANLSGLTYGTTYHYRLLAGNATGADETKDQEVTTAGPNISIEGLASAGLTYAVLQADIDPDESTTTYHFEYDTSPYTTSVSHGTSLPVPSAGIGSGTSAVLVSVMLQGLQPGGTYYYRVVAESRIAGHLEAFDGPGQVFTLAVPSSPQPETCANAQARAEQPYGLELPDCRAYELVSPLDKNGGGVAAYNSRASVSDESPAVAYLSPASFSEPRGAAVESRYISRRTAAGWSTQNVTPPELGLEAASNNAGFGELLFTPDLSQGVLLSENVALLPDEPEGYTRLYVADLATSPVSYQTVTNVTPPGVDPYHESAVERSEAAGVSTDLSHVVFQEQANLTANAKGRNDHVYEWVAGRLSLVDVPPAGEAAFEQTDSVGAPGLGHAVERGNVWHAVSANGRRVFFTGGNQAREEGQLYVRENPEQSPVGGSECAVAGDACTIEVSASQRTNPVSHDSEPDPNGPRPAFFRDANAEGTRVFFTSRAELTNDANTGDPTVCKDAKVESEQQGDCAANLYEYNLETKELTDLTPDNPEGAEVLGLVTAGENAGEEHSYVYFVANGVLATGENANKETAKPGNCPDNDGKSEHVPGELTCSLYVAHYTGGKWETRFIAALAGENGVGAYNDEEDWLGIKGTLNQDYGPGQHTVRVTPDGATLAFESERRLTGYDNSPVKPGGTGVGGKYCTESGHPLENGGLPAPCREVYLYNAGSGGAGSLTCASCDPSGALPVGPALLRTPSTGAIGVPLGFFLPRNLSESGSRLFFQSPDALVPHDSNGQRNVYEWERPATPAEAAKGENSCTSSSAAFSSSDGGCVFPVSDVVGDSESSFMDASPSGNNVFIATSDQLVPEADADTRQNVYDVRVGGGFPVLTGSPPCNNGDSCKPPVSPQPGVFAPPASATFSGPGNPTPTVAAPPPPPKKTTTKTVKCKKGETKNKKDKCVRKKTKKRAKRASRNRRTKS